MSHENWCLVNKDLVLVIGEYRTKVVSHEEMGRKRRRANFTYQPWWNLIHKLQSYFSYWNPLLATTCGTSELLNALLKNIAKSNIGFYALAIFDKIWFSNYFLHDMRLYINFGGPHSKLFFTLQCLTWGIQYMGSFSVHLRSITTLGLTQWKIIW
jgi:hypothetical protein